MDPPPSAMSRSESLLKSPFAMNSELEGVFPEPPSAATAGVPLLHCPNCPCNGAGRFQKERTENVSRNVRRPKTTTPMFLRGFISANIARKDGRKPKTILSKVLIFWYNHEKGFYTKMLQYSL